MLASYVIPYMGILGYVGANPSLNGHKTKRLLAGLLGVEAGQDAVIRSYLFERATEIVHPYNHTVAEFTDRVSKLRNKLANNGVKDEASSCHWREELKIRRRPTCCPQTTIPYPILELLLRY
ncbi:hypothetical protein Syun_028826 [Stephania yunnanensis]|uniref:Uncharacterized protein n=1 Tax=Stephania yunnanensis TaxID=152371 RepID=A0AAP0E8U3_9MAGN